MLTSSAVKWRALGMAICLTASVEADPRPIDRVVARVDGNPILLSDLLQDVRPRLAGLAKEPAWKRARALRSALNAERERAIEAALFVERAKSRGLSVSDQEVESALSRIAKDQRVSVDELLALAHAAGFSPEAYRTELRGQLLEQRVLFAEPWGAAGRPPSDSEGMARWQAKRRATLLAELGRRACVERLGRF